MKIVALDIGGTSIKAGEVTDGVLNSFTEYDTNAKNGGEYVIKRVIDIISEYRGFNAIGISTAGQVDSLQGIIRFANENIPEYTGMKVKELLQERFHVPVAVENDVNSAAIGEAQFGAGMEWKDFICLTYGTGIGGAIIIDKKIYSGSTFSAAEFGHIVTHAGGRACNCGLVGCYEQYASTGALVRAAEELDSELSDGRKIFERINEPETRIVVDEWINEILFGLASIIHIFNPANIVLGGGIMNESYIIERIKYSLNNYIMPSYTNVKISQALLGNRAGLLGAAYLAQRYCQ
jgi:predicted NBD/HSP70 family sugar kinase